MLALKGQRSPGQPSLFPPAITCMIFDVVIFFVAKSVSDVLMHHIISYIDLTFIQSHTYLNQENNKCLIISETIQAMPIKFVVKIVRLKVYMTIASLMTLTFKVTSASQTWLLFNLQYLGQYLSYYSQTWHDGWPIHGIYVHFRFDDLDLDSRS